MKLTVLEKYKAKQINNFLTLQQETKVTKYLGVCDTIKSAQSQKEEKTKYCIVMWECQIQKFTILSIVCLDNSPEFSYLTCEVLLLYFVAVSQPPSMSPELKSCIPQFCFPNCALASDFVYINNLKLFCCKNIEAKLIIVSTKTTSLNLGRRPVWPSLFLDERLGPQLVGARGKPGWF